MHISQHFLHRISNGYSFLRMMLEQFPEIENEEIEKGETFIDVIMRSHTAYYNVLTPLFGNDNKVLLSIITSLGL